MSKKVGRPRKYEGNKKERDHQAQKVYRSTKHGKAIIKAYQRSEEGRESLRKAKRKWSRTPKGKEYRLVQLLNQIERALDLISELLELDELSLH